MAAAAKKKPAAKAAVAPNPRAELEKRLAAVEKNIGAGFIHRASESPPVRRLPFFNPHLNYATEGGAPWNRSISLQGAESTGKTMALYQLYAMAHGLPGSMDAMSRARIEYHRGHGHVQIVKHLQDELDWVHDTFPNGAECCHYDIEGQFDPRRAAKLGIDIDRLFIVETNFIEEVCGTLATLWGVFHIHGLDSTSAAISQLVAKHEVGKPLVGTDSRQWKVSLRHALTHKGPLKNQTGIPNMLVMVHQMSMNVSSGSQQAAVGKYLKFESSCTLEFTRGSFLWKKNGVLLGDKVAAYGSAKDADAASLAGMAEADGLEVYVKVQKSRTCRPFRTAGLQFDLKKLDYVMVHELLSSGIYYGVITKSGNSWFSIDGEKAVQGAGKAYQMIADSEEIRLRIMSRLLDFVDEGDDIDMAVKQQDAIETTAEVVPIAEAS